MGTMLGGDEVGKDRAVPLNWGDRIFVLPSAPPLPQWNLGEPYPLPHHPEIKLCNLKNHPDLLILLAQAPLPPAPSKVCAECVPEREQHYGS